MIKDVRVGPNLRLKGITENHRGFPADGNIKCFGADTETVKGIPYTYQVSHNGETIIERITPKNIFPKLISWVNARALKGGVNVVFFHKLNFDLRSVFHKNLKDIYDQYNDIRFERDSYVVKMLYGKVNNAVIWEDLGGYLCPKCGEIDKDDVLQLADKKVCGLVVHGKNKPNVRRNLGKKVLFLDSAAFCPPGSKSLAAALKIYGVNEAKMKAPGGIGEKKIWTPYFKKYALNDAIAEEALGNAILNLHKEYEVTTCVSLPQLASRILRHHFFREGETLVFPPEPCRVASELSYHAGKNGFYVGRGIYDNVYEYDINSAFPKAMRELPQMVKGEYLYTREYYPGQLGIYRIRGTAKNARIPAIFEHDFKPIRRGEFRDLWVTGYEIETLLGNPDYEFKIVDGWLWEPDPSYTHSPLASFVDHFWKLKNEAPKGPKRDTYKNILNSLYGKFAACVEKRTFVDTAFGKVSIIDPGDPRRHFVAGALYHPFIASQITGYVRRDIFNLEKAGNAMHTATDSIKSTVKLPTSNDLGGVKLEVFGRCYLFRTKLYLHFAKTNEHCGHDLEKGWIRQRGTDKQGKIFEDGQHLCKWGLHGYKGDVFKLYAVRHSLMREGHLDYSYKHMVNLREGIKRGEVVSTMVDRHERLQLTK